ncbi:MAG: electron transport complex subunit RsxC [Candidatus Marinimicrobia bacterium]|nr:electron transport complex subunit RsxC [Candidatus Neomarinimicrobiota bacterium]
MKTPTFKKGLHPEDYKYLSRDQAIETLPLPDDVYIPLQQHIGASCEPMVEKGDPVKTGQIIANTSAYVSAPVHASVTGVVKDIGKYYHPLGMRETMIHIKREGEDEWEHLEPVSDWKWTPKDKLLETIRNAGVVGLGGATFPTHVKLNPPDDKAIDAFILNGVECEPYLTADDRLMQEQADKILLGMSIMMHILDVQKGYIGIENNKPAAIARMQKRVVELGYPYKMVPLKVKYPQGAEKMLIYSVLRRKVPCGKLPMDVGVVVNNVATAYAVAEAVTESLPLIRRVITVTGDGVNQPKNLMARLGTPFKDLFNACGNVKDDVNRIFMGGPMMGMTQYHLESPVVKGSSGIVAVTGELTEDLTAFPCIQCGACVRTCPMNLLPLRLSKFSQEKMVEELREYGLTNCIECGSCAFACPANIPLVQWIRVGKLRLREHEAKTAKERS